MSERGDDYVRHEWDAELGLGVQKLTPGLAASGYRIVLWGRCARCGQFVTANVDFKPSLVLPQPVTDQLRAIAIQTGDRIKSLACPGAPLPLPNGNGLKRMLH